MSLSNRIIIGLFGYIYLYLLQIIKSCLAIYYVCVFCTPTYNPSNEMSGLLEKSRVCGPPSGESNFHIFHLLMEHIGSDGSAYPYLNNTDHTFALKVTLDSIQVNTCTPTLPQQYRPHLRTKSDTRLNPGKYLYPYPYLNNTDHTFALKVTLDSIQVNTCTPTRTSTTQTTPSH